jgi:hypothetical protein
MKLNILGAEYEYTETTGRDDPRLEDADGWCGKYEKQILIEKQHFIHEQGGDMELTRAERARFIKRHELTHAFFNESGLDGYSENEQLITWIARQFPKMLEAFKAVDAL